MSIPTWTLFRVCWLGFITTVGWPCAAQCFEPFTRRVENWRIAVSVGPLSVIPLVDCCDLPHLAEQVYLSQEGWWVVSALATHGTWCCPYCCWLTHLAVQPNASLWLRLSIVGGCVAVMWSCTCWPCCHYHTQHIMVGHLFATRD